jgi:hypothetical protein
MTKIPLSDIARPFKFEPLGLTLSEEEVGNLKAFMLKMLPKADGTKPARLELYNRPDSWDEAGVINKIQNSFRDYIKETFFLRGLLEPRMFILLRTEKRQGYSELYENFDQNNEVLYTARVLLSYKNADFTGGSSSYLNYKSESVDATGKVLCHRNETVNRWVVESVTSGTRLDLIIVFAEPLNFVRYDEFEIDQTADDGPDY